MTNRLPTTQDSQVRMVAFVNLRAMCERASGTVHRYGAEVTNKTESRVRVWYDNGDTTSWLEFPAVPSRYSDVDAGNPRVFLEVIGGSSGADEDDFWSVTSSQKLWRDLDNPDDIGAWRTRAEWDADKPGGVTTWHAKVEFDVVAAVDDSQGGGRDLPVDFSAGNEVRDLIGYGDQVEGRWPHGAFKVTLTPEGG